MTRCHTCFNLVDYCTCDKIRGLEAILDTAYEGLVPTLVWSGEKIHPDSLPSRAEVEDYLRLFDSATSTLDAETFYKFVDQVRDSKTSRRHLRAVK